MAPERAFRLRVSATSLRALAKRAPLAAAAYRSLRAARDYVRFVRDYRRFQGLARRSPGPETRLPARWRDRLVCLGEATATTGFDRHYVYHPAWAARVLAETRPPAHVDIGSDLRFVSIVSAFVPVRFYDFRPPALSLVGLTCGSADLTALPFADASQASLSCMHVVEHVGLGRYGDPLDPDGDLRAMRELGRVVARGGSLLFVAPVGRPRLRFNGHRIYDAAMVRDTFSGLGLGLARFTLIPEGPAEAPPVENASFERAAQEDYGCGCFWFRRSQ